LKREREYYHLFAPEKKKEGVKVLGGGRYPSPEVMGERSISLLTTIE